MNPDDRRLFRRTSRYQACTWVTFSRVWRSILLLYQSKCIQAFCTDDPYGQKIENQAKSCKMDRHVEETDYLKHSEAHSFCYDHNNPLSDSNAADSKPNTFFSVLFSFSEHIWPKSPPRRAENSSEWFKTPGNRCLLLHLSCWPNLIQKYWKTKKLELKTFWGGPSPPPPIYAGVRTGALRFFQMTKKLT